MGVEPVVREDNGALGVRWIPGGCAVWHHYHPRRTTEEKAVQGRLVFHRVLRQGRFLFQRIPVQNPGKNNINYIHIYYGQSTLTYYMLLWVYRYTYIYKPLYYTKYKHLRI